MNSTISLEKVLDIKKWQTVQDHLSDISKLALITVDYAGNPITKHSNCRPFCQAVRKDPQLLKFCKKCDSRGGLEAAREKSPYLYLCHYHIVDLAIPIVVDDTYVGAILAGQVRFPTKEEHDKLEQIVSPHTSEEALTLLEEYRTYYHSIPVLTYEEVETASNLISSIVNYTVEEAIAKNQIRQLYEAVLLRQSTANTTTSESLKSTPVETMSYLKKELSDAITNQYLLTDSSTTLKQIHPLLKPVFEYIANHKSENLSEKDMAKLCHISSSYFSRLFSKEMGETFSSYIGKQKIEWSKQLLATTDLTISQISDELGYNDASYFIKMFKKHTSTTPASYRAKMEGIGK